MKTRLQEIINTNGGVPFQLYKKEGISAKTLTKAANGEVVRYTTRFRIYASLLEMQLITTQIQLNDLFLPVEENDLCQK